MDDFEERKINLQKIKKIKKVTIKRMRNKLYTKKMKGIYLFFTKEKRKKSGRKKKGPPKLHRWFTANIPVIDKILVHHF